jgi:hypothetical protein
VSQGPKLFTCPRCRHQYLGHDPLPDCPCCGYDYRVKEGVRWDLLVYLLAIMGLVSYLLVSSHYRTGISAGPGGPARSERSGSEAGEKLPGATGGEAKTFQSPYHEPGR